MEFNSAFKGLSEILSQMYTVLRVRYPLFLSYFNVTLNFHDRFSKNPQTPNSMKIRPMAAQLLHDDGAECHFSNFCEKPLTFFFFFSGAQYVQCDHNAAPGPHSERTLHLYGAAVHCGPRPYLLRDPKFYFRLLESLERRIGRSQGLSTCTGQ